VIDDKGTGALHYDADGTGKAAQVKIGQLGREPEDECRRVLRDLMVVAGIVPVLSGFRG